MRFQTILLNFVLIQLSYFGIVYSRLRHVESPNKATVHCIFNILQKYYSISNGIYIWSTETVSNASSASLIDNQFLYEQLFELGPIQVKEIGSNASQESAINRNSPHFVLWIYGNLMNEEPVDFATEFLVEIGKRFFSAVTLIGMNIVEPEEIEQTFDFLAESFDSQLLIMMSEDEQQWRLYSYESNDNDCDNRQSSQMWKKIEWTGDNCDNVEFNAPNSVSGKQRCPLRVSGIHIPPFSYYDDVKGFYNGIEYFMVESIAEKMHVDVDYRFLRNSSEYFDMLDSTGVFTELSME